jgi:hypothetical protein
MANFKTWDGAHDRAPLFRASARHPTHPACGFGRTFLHRLSPGAPRHEKSMGSTLIATARWSVDSPVSGAWLLLARTEDWPRWWTSVAQTRLAPPLTAAAQAPARRWPMSWPALLGRPLRLRVSVLTLEPMELLEWQFGGDVRARSAWLLDSAGSEGTAITCRWELQPPVDTRGLSGSMACWMLERRVFALTAALAQDMARTLRCRLTPLREWRGSVRHGLAPHDR